jgi:hypothetical protein
VRVRVESIFVGWPKYRVTSSNSTRERPKQPLVLPATIRNCSISQHSRTNCGKHLIASHLINKAVKIQSRFNYTLEKKSRTFRSDLFDFVSHFGQAKTNRRTLNHSFGSSLAPFLLLHLSFSSPKQHVRPPRITILSTAHAVEL